MACANLFELNHDGFRALVHKRDDEVALTSEAASGTGAELHAIRERHPEFEIDGDPMVLRQPSDGTFNPGQETPNRRCMTYQQPITPSYVAKRLGGSTTIRSGQSPSEGVTGL